MNLKVQATQTTLPGSELGALNLKRRADIDGLRGLAVLAVLGFHFAPGAVAGGYVGVDVFFVISGFVITNLLLRQPPLTKTTLAMFWGHRVRRIFPALALVLIATLISGWFILWPGQYLALGQSTFWSSLMAGNVYMWLVTGYFSAEPTFNPLLNVWSLGVEEQFYLAWPILLGIVLLGFKRRNRTIFVVVGLGLFSWLASLLYPVISVDVESAFSSVFYLPWFRAWELCAGAGIAAFLMARADDVPLIRSPRIASAVYVSAVVLLIGSIIFPIASLNPAVYAAPAVILSVIIIAIGAAKPKASRCFDNAPMLLLGKISYPLYLWHWPVLVLGLAAGYVLNLKTSIVMILISFALALLTWRLVEFPIQALAVTKTLVASLAALMVIIAGAGYVVSKAHGFPERSSQVAKSLESYSYAYASDYRAGECFIESGDSIPTGFASDCISASPGKSNILLWGDSHAAHLYAGLAAWLPPDATLSQLNISSCVPTFVIEDDVSTKCGRVNSLATRVISSKTIQTVVLAAFWSPEALVGLEKTIDALTDRGVRVVLVGPVPWWVPSLPRSWSFREANTMTNLPQYSSEHLKPEEFILNSQMNVVANSKGIEYFDLLATMCGEDGCLVRTGSNTSSLTAWDYGHLTRAGSIYVGERLSKVLAN